MPNIVILISGRGSNMGALLDAADQQKLGGQVKLVVSNRPNATGLQVAAERGVDTRTLDHTQFPDRESFDAALRDLVATANPDLVILAGFMRILTPVFVDAFVGRLINIHPSLLPLYPGLNTHQRAIEAGDAFAGATVHYVTSELDGGPPILQAREAIQPGDTPETLSNRILELEHQIYALAAHWHLSGRLRFASGTATLDGELLPATGMLWDPQCQ